jgi:hypothetical protein
VHLQEQSHLGGRLPAKVRNLIYAFLREEDGAVSENQEEEEEKRVGERRGEAAFTE